MNKDNTVLVSFNTWIIKIISFMNKLEVLIVKY